MGPELAEVLQQLRASLEEPLWKVQEQLRDGMEEQQQLQAADAEREQLQLQADPEEQQTAVHRAAALMQLTTLLEPRDTCVAEQLVAAPTRLPALVAQLTVRLLRHMERLLCEQAPGGRWLAPDKPPTGDEDADISELGYTLASIVLTSAIPCHLWQSHMSQPSQLDAACQIASGLLPELAKHATAVADAVLTADAQLTPNARAAPAQWATVTSALEGWFDTLWRLWPGSLGGLAASTSARPLLVPGARLVVAKLLLRAQCRLPRSSNAAAPASAPGLYAHLGGPFHKASTWMKMLQQCSRMLDKLVFYARQDYQTAACHQSR